MMPADGWDVLRRHDAILLGAIGSPDVPDHITLHGLLLPMRRNFDQYVNLRPAYLFDGVPVAAARQGARLHRHAGLSRKHRGRVRPRRRPALRGHAARGRHPDQRLHAPRLRAHHAGRLRGGPQAPRKKVTSITKSNAQQFGMVLWDEVFKAVAQDYPDVQTSSLLVDAAAMDFVRKPEAFDVVVASNLFGDILTDLSAIITGSMGLAASANINPERTFPSMFEPVHGSAPDIAGKGIANPLAAILSAGMLLDHLGFWPRAPTAVRNAVAAVLKAGKPRTPDLGGKAARRTGGRCGAGGAVRRYQAEAQARVLTGSLACTTGW